MPIIAQDSQRFSNVVKHEYDPSTKYCRETVVVNEAIVTGKHLHYRDWETLTLS